MRNTHNQVITFFVAETYPSFAGGGKNAFSVAEYLAKSGAITKVVCLNYNNSLKAQETKSGVLIKRILYFNRNLVSKIISLPILLINYLTEIIRGKTIFIYGCYLPGYLWIIIFAKLFRRKVVFRSTLLGDDDIKSLRSKPLWPFKRIVLKQVDLYFAINNDLQEHWYDEFNSSQRLFCSPQGVNGAIYNKEVRKDKKFLQNKIPVFLAVGILIERKGYREMFKALANLKQEFKLIVLGQHTHDKHHRSTLSEMNEMKELYKIGNELLGDKVIFKNTVDDITPFLSEANAMLYAGMTDGTPNAVLEAMAVGLPVIMYNAGISIPAIVPGETVIMFNSFERLLTLLEDFFKDSKEFEKIAINAANVISKNYTFDKVVSQLFKELYCDNHLR